MRSKQEPEAATKGVLRKKEVFLIISQNSQEKTCTRASLQLYSQPATLFKKRPWHRYFPVNFVQFLRTPFFTEHLRTTAS